MNRLEEALKSRTDDKPLLGMSVITYDPVFVELAGHLGLRVVWIEMEHAPITFSQAADLCRIAEGVGLLTMIRIPDARRENVLKAAECGPDIIDVPMAEDPEIAAELVRHARYAPQGRRGFYGASRALRYGTVGDIAAYQPEVNDSLNLMAQIETCEALEQADAIAAVPGLDYVFIGPGDLSSSLGIPGQTSHPRLLDAADRIIAAARRAGKRVAIADRPGNAPTWAARGVDLVFCGSNVTCLRAGVAASMKEALGQ